MSQRFTREEFYELVWTKPMTHLAKEFGLSDVALHKICRKHQIPNPPLGWWAKHAAGQKVKRTPLPKLGAEVSGTVVIAGGESRQEPEDIASAREQARVRASAFDPTADVLAHPIVTKSIEKLRAARPGPNGLLTLDRKGLIHLELAPGSLRHAERASTGLRPPPRL